MCFSEPREWNIIIVLHKVSIYKFSLVYTLFYQWVMDELVFKIKFIHDLEINFGFRIFFSEKCLLGICITRA